MSLAGQQLLRCPHCISVQPRGPGGELLLEPGENVCANRNCGRTFLGHQAILEDYPRDGLSRTQSDARRAKAERQPASSSAEPAKRKKQIPLGLFGGLR